MSNLYQDKCVVPSPPYPGYPLKYGSTGSNVSLMQTDLNAIREYLYPSLGFLKVDGIFGYNTQSTVMQYQQIKGIAVDGIIGEITWNSIVIDFSTIPIPSTDVYPGYPLSQGSTGTPVVTMQHKLNGIQPTYTAINVQAEDGVFGQNTADATRRFQKQFALTPDEVIGEKTWYAIVGVHKNTTAGQPANVLTKYPGSPVQLGSSGDSVRFVQSYMNTVGLSWGTPFTPVSVDGQFGSKTKALVITFQTHYLLKPDGIVGPKTWSSMITHFNVAI